jgi:hypothetical protein
MPSDCYSYLQATASPASCQHLTAATQHQVPPGCIALSITSIWEILKITLHYTPYSGSLTFPHLSAINIMNQPYNIIHRPNAYQTTLSLYTWMAPRWTTAMQDVAPPPTALKMAPADESKITTVTWAPEAKSTMPNSMLFNKNSDSSANMSSSPPYISAWITRQPSRYDPTSSTTTSLNAMP